MNSRLATVLSVAGVLVAGSVATVANSKVLADRQARDAGGVLATLPAAATTRSAAPTTSSAPTASSEQRSGATTASATSVGVTVGGQSPGSVLESTTAPDDQRPVTTLPSPTPIPSPSADPTPVPTTAAAPTQRTYRVAEAGIVVLDVTATSVRIHSLSPAPGWRVLSADNTSLASVRVVFASDAEQVSFSAVIANGVLADEFSRRAGSTVQPTSTTSRPPSPTTTERRRDDRTTSTTRRTGGGSTTEPPEDDGHARGDD